MGKYLGINNTTGDLDEIASSNVSTGATDAGKIPELDASGRLSSTMMPIGIVPDVKIFTALEALSAGDFVEITATGVRKADRSNGRKADGFVIAAVASAASATVYRDTTNTGVSGLTVGARYYLGLAGAITATVTTTSGQLHQYLGIALAATELDVEIDRPITRA